jgi:hypothetical protein
VIHTMDSVEHLESAALLAVCGSICLWGICAKGMNTEKYQTEYAVHCTVGYRVYVVCTMPDWDMSWPSLAIQFALF